MYGRMQLRDAMKLYGAVLGALFLFYLLGIFLGRNQLVEARPKEADMSTTVAPFENIKPELLDFYDDFISKDRGASAPGKLEENSTTTEQSENFVASGYTVQIGAFTTAIDAQQISIRLDAKGYDSVLITPSKSDPYYRVSVGHFTTDQEAMKLEEKLRKDGFPTYRKETSF